MKSLRIQVLNGNALKIIALIAMTMDHIGMICFPGVMIWRIIGRLAFPIFAFMIAEGCFYTKNKKKYILLILAVGIICQIVYFVTQSSLYMCIMITFTISVAIIFALQKAFPGLAFNGNQEADSYEPNSKWLIITALIIMAAAFLVYTMPTISPGSGFNLYLKRMDYFIDYGFFGILLPVIVYIPRMVIRENGIKLRLWQCLALLIGLIPVSMTIKGRQWFSLFAVIPLLLYNGERGKLKLKYLFYIYYPLHLGVIFLIYMLICSLQA